MDRYFASSVPRFIEFLLKAELGETRWPIDGENDLNKIRRSLLHRKKRLHGHPVDLLLELGANSEAFVRAEMPNE